ncbi:MAG: hypothetical protein ISS34_05515 [Candidatus Omnitrophica bacterium]|nr:hypothetical protein [Candidatus Omnitrophota bacterium]
MKKIAFLVLIIICVVSIGCGETVSGVGKDAGRIGKGVRTIFIRDGSE